MRSTAFLNAVRSTIMSAYASPSFWPAEGQVVLVSGDAGIGKSRLVHAFTALLDRNDHWRVICQC